MKKNNPDQIEVFSPEQLAEWKKEKPKRTRKVKCSICDELFDPNDDNENWHHTVDGKRGCGGCYENSFEYASTLVEFNPTYGKESWSLDKNFGNLTDGEASFPNPIKRVFWKSTDAWRGYTDWELVDGYITLSDGWVTGYIDNTTNRKKTLGDMYEDFNSNKKRPPVIIYWMFGHTSNVFSSSSSIIIAEKDKDVFSDWLKKEFDYTIEDLEYMFR